MSTEFSAFEIALGEDQGRCDPSNFSSDGEFSMVLGHDEPLHFARLRVGDMVTVHQTADVGTTKVLKARVRCRGPEYMPGATKWRFSLYVDGVEKAYRICTVGQTTDYLNFAVNLASLSGDHSIAFVLKLMES